MTMKFAGMTMKFAGMTLGAAVVVVPAASQPAPGWKLMTAKQLATACHSTDAAQHATCVGYVSGIYDLQFAPTPPRGVCPPQDLTPDLLTEVVTAYLDTHEDGPAPAAIGQAIVRFFPCPEARK
jgi:Rap1a immunity proteins